MVRSVHQVSVSGSDARPQSPITIQICIPIEAFQNLEDGQEVGVSIRKDRRYNVAQFTDRPGLAPPYTARLSRSISREELNTRFDCISAAYHEAGRPRAKSSGNHRKAAAEAWTTRRMATGFQPAHYNHLLRMMPEHPCLVYPLPNGTVPPQLPQSTYRGAKKRFFTITKGLAVGVFYGRCSTREVIRELVDRVPGAVYKKLNTFADAKAKFDSMYPDHIQILSPVRTTFN
ncbi:hypothetical protein BJ138DRAFT_1106839 [Hygrophoropsis aurantiaca]|uniref:Uncharacterized protein n=1 Tax=Hygrophoropsis aurantiaca TaxID=72124 RepID=A0ACB7ZTM8_9AGAM|nr:hypothetical protein BJ138DRAFT_1106839 [Hygrophoropsis aurantiaca]